jgi:NAD(P)-dependent dehydrogenase (short-subunit alcohol dehydrogenase family)
VLITAGAVRLGAAVARHFAKHGFRIVVYYSSNIDRANKLLDELYLLGKQPLEKKSTDYFAGKEDKARRDVIGRLVHEATSALGRPNVVLSNGGWTKFQDMTCLDDNICEEDWNRALNMNVKSHLWLILAAKEHLEKTEGSSIAAASLAGVSQQGSSLVFITLISVIRSNS